MESGASLPELRRRLIVVIVVLIIYNVVLGSFGPLGGMVPAPRIPFRDLTAAFLLYLLITRYKLIEGWLTARKESNPAGGKPENHEND